MQLETLTFSDELNFSLQVGDMVYYSPTVAVMNFQTINNANTIVELGVVTELYPNGDFNASPQIPVNSIVVSYDETTTNLPQLNDFIMFGKNKQVNTSSLIGYYAEVEFKNLSTDKIELFSISSEVSESSK
tara:strand:+ start:7840 stop:8232 length:393 start_codon:yes stop_codon:yes gene_type:complete